jgi:hypothetical protein
MLRNLIIGIAGYCARAASGHPATPLPTSAMNSRRLMGRTPRLKDEGKVSRCSKLPSIPASAASPVLRR